MKNLVFAIFGVTAVGIALLFALKPREKIEQTRIVTPQIVTVTQDIAEMPQTSQSDYAEDTAPMVSFIPLLANESLVQTLSVDFDDDGFEDQINAVRRGADPEIILLIGLYNSSRDAYERIDEIKTGITQTRTFSYTCMDITGTHKNALVFQGFLPLGDSIMRIFHASRQRNNFVLTTIGDFRSDGTIFISRVDRYETYETLGGAGSSYPVWVYSSDIQTRQEAEERAQSLDQLQTMYDWDSSRGRYMRVRQIRIPGQRLAQSEIQRIHDGTIETFAGFLDGLWYKTGAQNGYYVFFDYANREVTFYSADSQEVYLWERISLRRSGMYLSTINSAISNLSRLIDISLSGIDEIRLRIQDDLRMIINVTPDWDGSYIKISRKNETIFSANNTQNSVKDIFAALTAQKEWTTGTGEIIQFTKNNYALSSIESKDEGRFSLIFALGIHIIEFRSKTASPFFDKTYQIIKDGNAFTLNPVVVSPTRITPGAKNAVRLEAAGG